MKSKTFSGLVIRYAKPAFLLLLLAILGFTSCKTKPKTKYGPPPADYHTTP